MDTRICTKCGKEKSTSDFHKRLDGYQTRCRQCIAEWYKVMYYTDRAYRKSKSDAYHEQKKKPEYLKKRDKYHNKRYEDNPEYFRAKNYKRKYELTLGEYADLLEDQGYCCALCGTNQDALKRRLSVDHDHSCCGNDQACKKCIRGLLCAACNKRALPVLEQFPHLRSDFVSAYLRQRPFVDCLDDIVDRILEPEVIIAE